MKELQKHIPKQGIHSLEICW